MIRMKVRTKIAWLFFWWYLIFPIGYAQDYQDILSAVLGQLPSVCSDIESPLCWECLLIAKILPLAFFTGLGFMINLVLVGKILSPKEPKKTAMEFRITSIMLTIAISIAILHVANPEDLISIFSKVYNIWYWLAWMIVIVGVTYVLGGTAASIIRYILSFIIILVTIWFIFSSPVPEIAYQCMP